MHWCSFQVQARICWCVPLLSFSFHDSRRKKKTENRHEHCSHALGVLTSSLIFCYSVIYQHLIFTKWKQNCKCIFDYKNSKNKHQRNQLLTFVCAALSDPAKSIINSFPTLNSSMVFLTRLFWVTVTYLKGVKSVVDTLQNRHNHYVPRLKNLVYC